MNESHVSDYSDIDSVIRGYIGAGNFSITKLNRAIPKHIIIKDAHINPRFGFVIPKQ